MRLGLAGKTAIVTGATSGLGAGIAEGLAGDGAALAVVGRNEEALRRMAETLDAEAIQVVAVDLTAPGAAAAVVERAVRISGRIDVIVHSAGIYERGPLQESDVGSLDRQWAVNVRAPYELSLAALTHLRPGASIVFITSAAGRFGMADRVAYAATKGAAEQMMRSMAAELGPKGIRVNSVAPGFIATPMNERLRTDDLLVEYTTALTSTGRLGAVEDVVPVVLFLASGVSAFVHGETVGVDGGYPSPPSLQAWAERRRPRWWPPQLPDDD